MYYYQAMDLDFNSPTSTSQEAQQVALDGVRLRQIAQLLAQGTSQSDIARHFGLTPEEMVKIASRPEFAALVVAKAEQVETMDAMADKLQTTVLQKLQDRAQFMKSRELVALLAAVSKIKRMPTDLSESIAEKERSHILLNLPAHITNESGNSLLLASLTQASNNQVVAAGQQSFLPMPASELSKFLTKNEGEKNAKKLHAQHSKAQPSGDLAQAGHVEHANAGQDEARASTQSTASSAESVPARAALGFAQLVNRAAGLKANLGKVSQPSNVYSAL